MKTFRYLAKTRRLCGLHQRAFLQKHLPSMSSKRGEENSSSIPLTNSHQSFEVEKARETIVSTSELDENGLNSITRTVPEEPTSLIRHRTRRCTTLHCHCSCHVTRKVRSRFWYLEYTPLADILRKCDNALCTARRHRLEFRTTLSPFGISWALILGLDLTIEIGKCCLLPALQVQRVVKYTSPGFVTLWKLSENILSWDEAEAQFRGLYQSDPTFTNQVDPSGCSYLEVGHPLICQAHRCSP